MLQIKDIKKEYRTGTLVQHALNGVSLNLRDNEFVAILGPSGSGKTTLLNVIGGLDRYDSGELVINGLTTRKYSDADWDYYRNHTIGFVFQSYNLIPHQTLLANVELALTISGISGSKRKEMALAALDAVGLKEQAHKKPNQLSGGQMQRVAIARALVNDPDIVLADEPTGALDSETSIQVMELLKEVAKTRLVVMVTHNPELAEKYATRIVTIKDGDLIGDTDPYILSKEEEKEAIVKKAGKSSMSFKTALSLSFNNLMTKKARTLLVSAAGSIGIIGIALIIALSSGANAYIAKTEREAMAAYPLQITSVGYNIPAIAEGAATDMTETSQTPDEVGVIDTISQMFSGMADNDLRSLKDHIQKDPDFQANTRSVQYIYNVTPEIWQEEADGVYKVYPSKYTEPGSSNKGEFYELPGDSALYEDQYDIKAGHWPNNKNEAVLILTPGDKVTDTILYTLGLRDRSEMDAMMDAMQSGKSVQVKKDDSTYTFDSFLNTKFRVVPASAYYHYDEANHAYTSMMNDKALLQETIMQGEPLTITGIAAPKEGEKNTMLSSGIWYPSQLTTAMIHDAAESDVVKAQLQDPNTNVFTGAAFTDENAADTFSLENIFTIDEDAFAQAFNMNMTLPNLSVPALDLNIDPSTFLDPSALSIDLPSISQADITKIIEAANIQLDSNDLADLAGKLVQGYDPGVLNQYIKDVSSYLNTQEAKQIITEFLQNIVKKDAANTLTPDHIKDMVMTIMQGYPAFAKEQEDPNDFATNLPNYLNSQIALTSLNTSAEDILHSFKDVTITTEDITNLTTTLIQGYEAYAKANDAVLSDAVIQSFIDHLNSPSIQAAIQDTVLQSIDTEAVSKAFTDVLQRNMSGTITSLSTSLNNSMNTLINQVSNSITNSLSTTISTMTNNLDDMFQIDPNALAKAIKINMTPSDLEALLSSLMSNDSSSYANNLRQLGYADITSPDEIDIYPLDFHAKENITDLLTAYNNDMKEKNMEDKVIVYTDYTAAMLSSVTTIVNTISYVLIAFVGISLVVSSIMIGVITYISVLERRKEIGILRALGASKHNVAEVFNAETFITGLLAGCIGVTIASLLLIPGNVLIHAITGNTEINAYMPIPAALGLILLSILLTVLAGLLPAQKASKSDPVTALRTE